MALNGTKVREYFNRENYEHFSIGLRLAPKSDRLLKKANSEITGASYLSITRPFTEFVPLQYTD